MKKDLLLTFSVLGVMVTSSMVIGIASFFSINKKTDRIDENTKCISDYEVTKNKYSMIDEKKENAHKLSIAPDPYTANKTDIYHIMLHTIDYFDKASGRLFACTTQDGIARMTDFATCMTEPYAYSNRKTFKIDDISLMSESYFSQCECVQTLKQYYSSDSYHEVDDINKTYSEHHGKYMLTFDELYPIEKREIINIPDEERVSYDENGERHSAIMPDPTNIIDSSVFLFPQNYAMGYLSDFDLWNINGIENYNGRQCYSISGEASYDYGAKLGVDKFDFLIDCNTGVILKYEAYDSYGQLRNYLYTENIRFDEDVIDAYIFDYESVKGYECTN